MRRKNLICTAGLIFFLFVLHGLGIPLKSSVLSEAADETVGENHILTGRITKIEQAERGGYDMEVRLESVDGRSLRGSEKILVRYNDSGEASGCGDEQWQLYQCRISFHGVLTIPESRRNPGCFDYQLYLKSRNIFFVTETDFITVLKDPWAFINQLRRWLIQQRYGFTEALSEDAAGLMTGMLFGDTSLLDESVYEEFRNNGTAHVLAVSGLHVGILYAIYKRVFGSRQTIWSMLCLALLLAAYGTLSMWSASMCRASLMIVLHETAKFLDLRYDMTTGLCTSAMVLILQNPYCIFSTGFQMSFLAIVSICFFTRILPRKIPDGMAAGIAVNLGLLMYQMYQFNYVSFLSVFINIPIIYLTGILVPLAMAGFLVFIATGGIPDALQFLMDSYCTFTIGVNRISTLKGLGSMETVSPPLLFVLCGYFLLFYFTSEQNLIYSARRQLRKNTVIIVTGFVCCILSASVYSCPVSSADIVFVDVGQGDCIHIRDGRKNVLIDGGGNMQYNMGNKVLKPYLLKNRVWNVDLALATHTHMDHYRGLEELEAVYPVKMIKTGMTAGQKISVSESLWIETLWPLEIDPALGQEENAACSVFMIHYGRWRILITGDLDETGEQEMLSYYEKKGETERLNADILKIGHHGSATSTCDLFLDTVAPKAAVIQVGKSNRYGHPSQNVVEKCRKKDIILVRNDYNGAIGFSFREDRFRINTVL